MQTWMGLLKEADKVPDEGLCVRWHRADVGD